MRRPFPRFATGSSACQDVPGQELFGYLDEDGTPRDVTSHDVNDYIKEISGEDFTAKDFRTWLGTVQCALLLAEHEYAETRSERSYIHPEIIAAYAEDGTIGQILRGKPAKVLLPEERFVIAFLKKRAKESPSQRTTQKLKASLTAQKKTNRAA